MQTITPTFDDQKTWKYLSSGRTAGIFQVEGSKFSDFLRKMKPNHINQLIDSMAIFRPGPLGSGMVDSYVNRLHGQEETTYLHPSLSSVLKDTYGLIIYQEQVMKIAHKVAGYSLPEADTLRKAVSKKKPEEMAKEKEKFINGCINSSGYSKELAETLFRQIETFADYGFNQSHAACYGIISYHTAWLKANYPLEYITSLLNAVKLEEDFRSYVQEAKDNSLKILPPDINKSKSNFSILSLEKNEILYGFSKLKGVGEKVAIKIEKEQPFSDFVDFYERMSGDLNSEATTQLISAGAFNNLGYTIKQLLDSYDAIHATYKDKKIGRKDLVIQHILSAWKKKAESNDDPLEFPEVDLIGLEKKAMGVFLSRHPLDLLKENPKFNDVNYFPIAGFKDANQVFLTICYVDKIKVKKTRKGQMFHMVSIEDKTGITECPIFGDSVRVIEEKKIKENFCAILKLSRKRGSISILDGRIP